MKHKVVVILLFFSACIAADCKTDCQEAFLTCVAKDRLAGTSGYFNCIKQKKDCLTTCPLKGTTDEKPL